jgi:hypothetical protein
MNWARFFTAFLIAPLAPVLLFVIPSLLTGGSGVLGILLLASFVTYAHALILGAPVACLLVWRKQLTLWRVVGAAFLIGALPFAGFSLYQESTMSPGAGYISNGVALRENGHLTNAGLRSAVFSVLQCGLLGSATGFVWWLIARSQPAAQTT